MEGSLATYGDNRQDGDVQRIIGETLAGWLFFAYPSEKYGSQMGSLFPI